MSPREQMKASVLHAFGEAVRVTLVPLPRLEPGHVLVRTYASGVNPLDTKIRVGAAAHARTTPPAILGIDLAGVVEAVADDVTCFDPGDEVYGMAGGVGGLQGSLAEYAAVDSDLIALKPRSWTFKEAASAPLALATAWEGLVDRAQVGSPDTVLIHGGAGGVGHLAVELAVSRGATVFATGTETGADTIRSSGATFIDYTATQAEEYVLEHTGGDGFDIIFDTIGGATLDTCFASVRRHTGRVVSILGWGTHNLAPLSFRGASYSGVFTLLPLLTGEDRAHHGDILRICASLAESGALTPLVDPGTFTLETAHEAHHILETRINSGKVVVEVVGPARREAELVAAQHGTSHRYTASAGESR
jgi:NADPH:quinone reductase-like Zn-dependent oxidoreductase